MLHDEFLFCCQGRTGGPVNSSDPENDPMEWVVGIWSAQAIDVKESRSFKGREEAEAHAVSMCRKYGRLEYVIKSIFQAIPNHVKVEP